MQQQLPVGKRVGDFVPPIWTFVPQNGMAKKLQMKKAQRCTYDISPGLSLFILVPACAC